MWPERLEISPLAPKVVYEDLLEARSCVGTVSTESEEYGLRLAQLTSWGQDKGIYWKLQERFAVGGK